MSAYTNQEADCLIAYYTPKMVGQFMEKSHQMKVIRLEKKSETGSDYLVTAVADRKMGVIDFFKEIGYMADFLNLLSPEDVLKDKGLRQ